MAGNYWIVLGLMVVFGIVSIYVGYRLGKETVQKQINRAMLDKVYEEVRTKYMKNLEREFNKAVERRAIEIVTKTLDILEEREKNNESIDSSGHAE